MDRKTRRMVLGSATVVVWSLVFYGLATKRNLQTKYQQAALSTFKVQLNTTPNRVRVVVDGERLFGGEYRETPIELVLSRGQHTIRISRKGYVAHTMRLDNHSKETFPIDVVLDARKDRPMGSAAVEMLGDQEPVFARINKGFAEGYTRLQVDDLELGSDHMVDVFPDWPETNQFYRCLFNLPADLKQEEFYALEVRYNRRNQLRIDGCKKLTRRRFKKNN